MKNPLYTALGAGVALAALAAGTIDVATTSTIAAGYPASTPLLALLGAKQWLNTAPLRDTDLRGKVVIVNPVSTAFARCLTSGPGRTNTRTAVW